MVQYLVNSLADVNHRTVSGVQDFEPGDFGEV
jgi:hypothetical protein